jgi:hypothetical protein
MATTAAPQTEPLDPETGTGSLASKLARIMGRLDRIDRDGRVDGSGGGYTYASADTLSDVLRPALAAEGVVMLPTDVEVIEQRIDEQEKQGKGGDTYTQTRYTCALRVEWILSDGETEYRLASVGTGVDYAGKAANAAHTFARVNAFKSAFHLSTGDDPEAAQGSAGGGFSRGAQGSGTGELPDFDPGAGVRGDLAVGSGGQVGIFFSAEDRGAFDTIKDAVKGIPGRKWNGDAKRWIVPADQAGTAVVLARHLGLAVPADLAARFPEQAADDLGAAPGPESSGSSEADDIPF